MGSVVTSNGDSMPEAIDLLSVPNMARSLSHTVAWRRKKAVNHAEVMVRVGAWRRLLSRTSGQAFALSLDDNAEFAAALFGAWQAKKIIYLPGDRLADTCAAMRYIVDGYLGDFAPEWTPRIPKPEDGAVNGPEDGDVNVDSFAPLDSNFAGLVLYTSGTTGAAQAIPKQLSQLSAEVATLEKQFG